jgi:hypothetical protein
MAMISSHLSAPTTALHLGEVGEDADGLMLAFADHNVQLRLEAFDVVGRHFAHNFKAQYPARTLS